MPKNRVIRSKGRKPDPVTTSFKLGGRKSGVSALSLSTEELLERLAKGGKEVVKIVQVLDQRGVVRTKKVEATAEDAES